MFVLIFSSLEAMVLSISAAIAPVAIMPMPHFICSLITNWPSMLIWIPLSISLAFLKMNFLSLSKYSKLTLFFNKLTNKAIP